MKNILMTVLVLGMATSALAADVTGRASLTIYPDNGTPFAIDIREQGGKILGQGNSAFSNNTLINLDETPNGGLKGIALGRFLNIVCTATECADQGATNLSLKVTQKNGAMSLDGIFNFVFVNADLSDAKMSLSADGSYDLIKTADGVYSGDGAYNLNGINPFHAELQSEGSLKGLTNPAAFIVLMVNPFVR